MVDDHATLLSWLDLCLCQIFSSALLWFYMVQLIGLPASNPEQPVSLADNMPGQSQHSTDHHLGCVIGISILDIYVGWVCMCCGVPSTILNQQTALLQNCPPIPELPVSYLAWLLIISCSSGWAVDEETHGICTGIASGQSVS